MFLKKVLLLTLVSLTACQYQAPKSDVEIKPKNIILFVGDGMGPAYIKAYRMFRDDLKTVEVEQTVFDQMLVGAIRTDPIGHSGVITDSSASAQAIATGNKAYNGTVTDSAASATAYATGKKTTNGTLSVSGSQRPIPTVLERAKELGKSTGIVVTSQLYHATPAAFITHHSHREDYAIIADQFFDNQFEGLPYADVMLGGGNKYFEREDRNISDEFASINYQVVKNRDELVSSTGERLFGLFANSGLKRMMDRSDSTPSLAEMTEVAIQKLSNNEQGFFLLVEGSQIDWAGHRNDIVGAMSEMQDFESAISTALAFAKQRDDTQIIVTADHSTGGLSVGAEVNGESHYHWNSEVVRSFRLTPNEIALRAKRSGNLLAEFVNASTMTLSDADTEILRTSPTKNIDTMIKLMVEIVNRYSYTGWTTEGHTGVDVYLYAFGPVSQQLVGHWDNTAIADFIFSWLE